MNANACKWMRVCVAVSRQIGATELDKGREDYCCWNVRAASSSDSNRPADTFARTESPKRKRALVSLATVYRHRAVGEHYFSFFYFSFFWLTSLSGNRENSSQSVTEWVSEWVSRHTTGAAPYPTFTLLLFSEMCASHRLVHYRATAVWFGWGILVLLAPSPPPPILAQYCHPVPCSVEQSAWALELPVFSRLLQWRSKKQREREREKERKRKHSVSHHLASSHHANHLNSHCQWQ